MEDPKISVVMSAFNAEKYIALSIESILNQSFRDFEFIIWNDGSTDGTEEIVLSYKDDRIKYFSNINTGTGEASRLACLKARGKYIARMDADDISYPDRLMKEYEYMESHPKCVVVSSAVDYIDEDGEFIGTTLPYTWSKILHTGFMINNPASMFRRDAYLKTGGYFNILGAEDANLWTRMVKYGDFHNIMHPLIKYRIVTGSMSHFLGDDRYLKILNVFREKLACNDELLEDDLSLHNEIFRLYKSTAFNTKYASNKIKPNNGYKHFRGILVLAKNIYGYFRYCIFRHTWIFPWH